MDKRLVKILGNLKPKKQQGGPAFEYAVAMALEHLLRRKAEKTGRRTQLAGIEHSPRADMLRKAFDNLPVITGRKAKVSECAMRAAQAMMLKFPDLEGPIRLIGDDAGRETEDGAGDVCDMEIGREDGRVLGISCKLNNDELKHPRMSATSDLSSSCFGAIGEEVAGRQAEIFREIEKAALEDPDQNLTWKNWKEGGERKGLKLIQELKNMTLDAMRRRVEAGSGSSASRMMDFVLGTRDYVLVRADDKNKDPKVELRFHNPRATLDGGVDRTVLPDRVSRVMDDSDQDGAAFVMMIADEDGRESLGLRFRLHSAATSVQPSLKWSVKWAVAAPAETGTPRRMLKKHCWEVENAGALSEDPFGNEFLPTLPGGDEMALLIASAGARGRGGIEDFSTLCSLLRLSGDDRTRLEERASLLLVEGRGVLDRSGACLGLIAEVLDKERLPSAVMVAACAVRVAAEYGSPLEEDEFRTIQEAVSREVAGAAKEALAGRCGADEVEEILGSLLPPASKPFRFGVAEGSRAKTPSAIQIVKNMLCEGWRGEDSPLRRGLQGMAALTPSLVARTEEERAAGFGSTKDIWRTIQEDIREGRPISMTPQKWERRLDGFAAELTGRILSASDGGRGAGKVHEAVLAAMAGYNFGDRYVPGFPFDGDGEEQHRWIDSLPKKEDGGWDRVKVGSRRRLWQMEVGPDDVAWTARRAMELMAEDDLRGDAVGTALLIVSLDGRPLSEVLGKLATQMGCGSAGALVENATKFGMTVEGEFRAGDDDQCRRLAGVMAVAGVAGGECVPSEILLRAVAGSADADSIREIVAREVGENGKTVEDKTVLRRAACVAMGTSGLVRRPYPVSGAREEREDWKDELKSGPQVQFVLAESGSTSERGGNAFVKLDDILRACDRLDELWQGGGRGTLQELDAYAISVLGVAPRDFRERRKRETKTAPSDRIGQTLPPSSPIPLSVPSRLETGRETEAAPRSCRIP